MLSVLFSSVLPPRVNPLLKQIKGSLKKKSKLNISNNVRVSSTSIISSIS